MRRGVLRFVVIVCAVFTLVSPVCLQARSMYVRDWIVITLRSAPNETSSAMGTASTNDMVEVLEDGQGWERIRTTDGKEGWVASRFLSAQPPKSLHVKQIEEKLNALQIENMRLRGLIAGRTTAGVVYPGTGIQGTMVPDSGAFADCPKLKADYDRLVRESKECTQRISVVDAENSRLKTSERLMFTFIGGVFIVLGIVIGLFVQVARTRSKKQGYKF